MNSKLHAKKTTAYQY